MRGGATTQYGGGIGKECGAEHGFKQLCLQHWLLMNNMEGLVEILMIYMGVLDVCKICYIIEIPINVPKVKKQVMIKKFEVPDGG